jgi:hypothetical protein
MAGQDKRKKNPKIHAVKNTSPRYYCVFQQAHTCEYCAEPNNSLTFENGGHPLLCNLLLGSDCECGRHDEIVGSL